MVRAQAPYTFKDFPHSSHRVLIKLVGPHPAHVLDVGASTGFLGEALAARGHTVVGVESDAEAGAARSRESYAAFHVLDAQHLPMLPEAPFDVAILGDVLEHLAAPEEALALVAAQVRPEGRILVSVPNVAFISIRLGLVVGRFKYRPRGILDQTHLRFFTQQSLKLLLVRGGLDVRCVLGVPPPFPLVAPSLGRWPGRLLLEAAALAARARPTLLAYQLVAEAIR